MTNSSGNPHQRLPVYKEDSPEDAEECPQVIPLPMLAHEENHERNKNHQRDDLLRDFELGQR